MNDLSQYICEKLILTKNMNPTGRFTKIIDSIDSAFKSIGYEKNDSSFEKVDLKEGYIYYIYFKNEDSKMVISFQIMNCKNNTAVISGYFRYKKKGSNSSKTANKINNYVIEFNDTPDKGDKILNNVFGGHDKFYLLTDETLNKILDGIEEFKHYKDSFQLALNLKKFSVNKFNDLVYVIKKLFEYD